MNTSHHFAASDAGLKLKRQSGLTAVLAEPIDGRSSQSEVQHQIAEDLAHLRDREENLRAYEVRLRAMQVELEAQRDQFRAPARLQPAPSLTSSPFASPSSRNPFDDGSLQAAWDKLHRARALVEAEQSHLREDRLALNDERTSLKRREDALAAREARFAALHQPKADSAPVAAVVAEDDSSKLSKFTRSPFAMAKSVFSAKR
jgi:hypothetical protein